MKISNINSIKKRGTLFFAVKLVLFLAILFVLDSTIGGMLKYFYFRQDSGFLYRTTYALDSTRAEILIFGSSTANHHYRPVTFERRLNMSCYNTGRDGNNIFYNYAILKSVLKRYTPKMAILDFNDEDFMKDQDSYDRITSLLPYYDNNPELHSIILLKSPFEKFKLISKIYPYNSLLFSIGVGNSNFNKSREVVIDENGFVPLSKIWKEPLTAKSVSVKYELDTIKINMFKSFIKDCINSKIKLYIFLSPKFIKFKNEDQSIMIAQNIANKYDIPFYNYSNDSLFLYGKGLFYNPGHLNEAGAKIYTDIVINKIIQNEKLSRPTADSTVPMNKYLSIKK
jgi:hypothetical protein